jgi:hypothetical protein
MLEREEAYYNLAKKVKWTVSTFFVENAAMDNSDIAGEIARLDAERST